MSIFNEKYLHKFYILLRFFLYNSHLNPQKSKEMNKNKSFAVPKPVRPTSKRTNVDVPTIPKSVPPKERILGRKSIAPGNFRANTTVLCDESVWEPEDSILDIDLSKNLQKKNDYEKFLRNMLTECLVEEKIKKEETQMDIQMAQLADRFQKTMDQLDKTNKRLKDINFVVEQKRLADLKNKDCCNFYNVTEKVDLEVMVNNLTATEEARLDKLETFNIDFGYDNETGHKKLLDTVNDAIDGLESIRRNCNLDSNKFHAYEETHASLDLAKKDEFNIESLKSEFDTKFPKFSEKILKDVSDKIASFMDDN